MAETFDSVMAKLQAVAAGVDRLEAVIASLKAGQVLTQDQLDQLGAAAAAIGADIDDTSDQG